MIVFPENRSKKTINAILVVISLFYFLPLLLLGPNAYITIHDNLDSDVQYLEVLKKSGKMFAGATEMIDNVMNGIPRAAYKSSLNFTSVLFSFFPSHWAYVINYIFCHVMAFFGMFLLLRKHFIVEQEKLVIVTFISVLFALLPFYSIYGLTVAGQPLFFYALFNLKNNKGKMVLNYLIIALLPFFLLGYLISPFLLIVGGLMLIADRFKTKKINRGMLIGLGVFFLFTLLADYQMYFMTFIKSNFVSHRVEWQPEKLINLNVGFVIQSMITLFFQTTYHVGSMPTKIIFVLFLLALSVSLVDNSNRKVYLITFGSIIAIILFYGLYFYIDKLVGDKVRIIRIFQWNRFYFLLSFCWLFLLAIIVSHLSNYKILKIFILTMLLFQLVYIIRQNKELINNWKILLHMPIGEPTYAQYYSVPLFEEINRYIGQPKSAYRVASLGVNPAVAAFNGFYTLDGYQNSYDVNYKHEFRKIIAKELEKNLENRNYFDYWGSRCYLVCNEYIKKGKISILDYDFDQYKKLGGKFLISGVPIQYPDSCGLQFEKRFADNSYYTIYLYKIK